MFCCQRESCLKRLQQTCEIILVLLIRLMQLKCGKCLFFNDCLLQDIVGFSFFFFPAVLASQEGGFANMGSHSRMMNFP